MSAGCAGCAEVGAQIAARRSGVYALRDRSGRTYGVFPTRQQAETWRATHRNPDELTVEPIPK